jgi:Bifunctional DNA primase/polymerase, N-terminal
VRAFRDDALEAAAWGWSVFPAGGVHRKEPLTEHGFLDATLDEATIRAWWKRWPGANIAVATEASCLAVLDVDPAGLRRFGRMRLPRTAQSITGRGGYHVVFAAPEWRVTSGAGRLGEGLDVKAAGGYIIVPGSIHENGNQYRWHRSPAECQLAKWPFPPPAAAPRRRFDTAPLLAPGESTGKGRDLLAAYVRKVEAMNPGGRHDTLFWAACRSGELVARGLIALDVSVEALTSASGSCGLIADEGLGAVQRTISDGIERGMDDLAGAAS